LCREYNIPFRKAHAIVGETVRGAIKSGLKLSELSSENLSSAAEKILGRKISISRDFIKKFTDPLSSLTARRTLGCPSPTESARMLGETKKSLAERQLELAKRLGKLEKAERELSERVKRVIRKKG
jgi:argininosuccinate lyase